MRPRRMNAPIAPRIHRHVSVSKLRFDNKVMCCETVGIGAMVILVDKVLC